jgi:Fur family peroxide stress response transcriptional regulator
VHGPDCETEAELMHSFEETIMNLRGGGFKLTPQRLAVIKYMIGNENHPSALSIHKELKRKYRSLSFSTVYNTLNMLERIGEVQPLNARSGHLNYDPNTQPHLHFYCVKCDTIHDIYLDDATYDVKLPAHTVAGHHIDSYQLIFRGTCKNCL